MSIATLFKQDVARPIETVVKAEDRGHVLQEVSEYVVTRDIEKKIASFFDAYVDFSGINGAWISGFFGSGKSHLLKILSHVLDNRAPDGQPVGTLFATKVQDSILKGNIELAGRIPSESILFNIDNQAGHQTGQQLDTLLPVFYQVFYEHLGFHGSTAHIGAFEWMLWRDKKYEAFLAAFEKADGRKWVDRRRNYAFGVKNAVAAAMGELYGGQAEEYLEVLNDVKATAATMSVEDFCTKVKEYIDRKPAGFRLNFFVDEVGQFIGNNTRLMLNLQTIAETLAVKCQGRAWVLVTSQDALENIVGDMTAHQQHDFSRITARFKTKLPLTSANVDEVIQKRLLTKNDAGKTTLKSLWNREHANLGTLLRLSSTGIQFREFQSEDDFVCRYPFIPYQFPLFQECVRQLSVHNAFAGRHASVGERSMLSVCQDVLVKMAPLPTTALVSFDRFFDGLRNTIKAEIQAAIILAESNLDDPLALRLLKVLFLVKYYTRFSGTVRNLAVLLMDEVGVDVAAHEQQVKAALDLLEQQTYVRRNGDLYEYLTDEEKDIENAINAVELDPNRAGTELHRIFFDEIIADTKLRYIANKQEYGFTRKVDSVLFGREAELVLDIVTPYHPQYDDEPGLLTYSMGYSTLALFRLPPDERLLPEVRTYLRTEKYTMQQLGDNPTEAQRRILHEKQERNEQRFRALVSRSRELLGQAKVWVNGREVTAGTSADGRNRVIAAFQELVNVAYPHLTMLNNVALTDADVRSTIQARPDSLFAGPQAAVSTAEQQILNFVEQRKQQSERTTVAEARDKFGKKPYGWYPNAVYTLLAKLHKRGKLELKRDSTTLDDAGVLEALLNSRQHPLTTLEVQVALDARLVSKLRELYQAAFDKPCPSTEAKEITALFRAEAASQLAEVNTLLGKQSQYPFLAALEPVRALAAEVSKRDATALVTQVQQLSDDWLTLKEDVLDPIRQFMNGGQRSVFDQVRTFTTGDQSNFEFVEHPELEALKAVFEHKAPYRGRTLADAKASMAALQARVIERIGQERQQTLDLIEQLLQQLQARPEYGPLAPAQQAQVLAPLQALREPLAEQRLIAVLRNARTRASDDLYLQALSRLTELAAPPETPDAEEAPGTVKEPRVQYTYIKSDQIRVKIGKTELQNPTDVDEYLTALRQQMLGMLEQNRRIVVPG